MGSAWSCEGDADDEDDETDNAVEEDDEEEEEEEEEAEEEEEEEEEEDALTIAWSVGAWRSSSNSWLGASAGSTRSSVRNSFIICCRMAWSRTLITCLMCVSVRCECMEVE
jgi:hypothetical protein